MAPAKKDLANYQNLQAELDVILADLQLSELDIDTALQRYKRGLVLVHQLEVYLTEAENQITELKASFEQSS